MAKIRESKMRYWLLSLLLLSPVICLYLSHFIHGWLESGFSPTGFIQYDMLYYMANAREHFDSGAFSLTYGNPFSPFAETPRIYFQPLTLGFAIAGASTQLDPGIIFISVGFLFGLFCIRSAVSVYERLHGITSLPRMLGLVLFIWGGGILAVSGGLHGMVEGGGGAGGLFRFDPFDGWWFLNLGRNLIYPTEAFYHLLVFSVFLEILKKRFRTAILLLALLSISHPFTGLQFVLIFLVWTSLERFYFRNLEVPGLTVPLALLLLLSHVLYYMVFLPAFPEHASLMAQWSLPWTFQATTMVLAYGVGTALVLWRIRRPELAGNVISKPENRLLLIWLLISFGLANHEFAIDPVQPLHFTRGYIWIPLFLLGVPVLIKCFEFLLDGKRFRTGGLVAMLILAVVLSDNGIWFADHACKPSGVYLPQESDELLTWLKRISTERKNALLITNDSFVAYAGMVYTPLRSWYSHWACSPFAKKRKAELAAYFDRGTEHPLWAYWDLIIVERLNEAAPTKKERHLATDLPELFRNETFRGLIKAARKSRSSTDRPPAD